MVILKAASLTQEADVCTILTGTSYLRSIRYRRGATTVGLLTQGKPFIAALFVRIGTSKELQSLEKGSH